MTFVADQVLMETRDVNRKAMLRLLSGGSGGSKFFEIELPDRVIQFSAELEGGGWKVRMCLREDRNIISEALIAFGYGHGYMVDQIHEVLFLEKDKGIFKTSYRWVNAQTH